MKNGERKKGWATVNVKEKQKASDTVGSQWQGPPASGIGKHTAAGSFVPILSLTSISASTVLFASVSRLTLRAPSRKRCSFASCGKSRASCRKALTTLPAKLTMGSGASSSGAPSPCCACCCLRTARVASASPLRLACLSRLSTTFFTLFSVSTRAVVLPLAGAWASAEEMDSPVAMSASLVFCVAFAAVTSLRDSCAALFQPRRRSSFDETSF